MQQTFEEWLQNKNFDDVSHDTLIMLHQAWSDGYDAGINKTLELQTKVNAKKLSEAFGGL